jgi:hypothetical protein
MSLIDIVTNKLNPSNSDRIVFSKILKYAKESYTPIGSGSARAVFKISDDYVVKIAKNEKGIAQNQKEFEISEDGGYDSIITKILATSPNLSFIISEQAKKLKKSEFYTLMGFNLEYLQYVLQLNSQYRNTDSFGSSAKPPKSEEAKETVDLIKSFVADYTGWKASGDIPRISSWGKVVRDGVEQAVMVDYGIDESILRNYYGRKI